MESLKTLSCEKFRSQLRDHWISDTLTDCIRKIYRNTLQIGPGELRQAVVEMAAEHRKDLVSRRAFLELIEEGGEFAVDLFNTLAQGISSTNW